MNKQLLYFLLLITTLGFCQPGVRFSNNTTLSVLTCGSGDELYSQFGHSAIRVKDNITGLDLVYNYGVFDSDDPYFYVNFSKGKLIYKMGVTDIANFYAQYQWENREVKEQVLNLTSTQERTLIDFLQKNIKPENTKYQYDFLFNNCATKITEVLNNVLNNKITYNRTHITTNYTFRDLINNNVPHNSWANVGINIALGSVIDVKASKVAHDFLPSYVFYSLEHASLDSKSLITNSKTVLKRDLNKIPTDNLILSPLVVFSVLALLIIWITYRNYIKNTRSKALDFSILLITGLIGVLVSLLWFATNHTATANNFNLLWGFTPNLLVAFSKFKNRKWHANYYLLLFSLMVIMAFVWMLNLEAFAVGAIPLFIALGIHYFFAFKFDKKTTAL